MKHHRYAVLLSIVGLVLIHLSSTYVTAEEAETDELKPGWIGKKVVVNGTATEVSRFNETLIFTLKDSEGAVKVAEFRSDSDVSNGEKVEVKGTVKIYRGNMEIVADSIK